MTPLEHARQRAGLAEHVRKAFRAAWMRVDKGNIQASWMRELPRLMVLLTSAQQVAAASADSYVARTLKEPLLRELIPSSLAFIASDGRPLDSLLIRPAMNALKMIGHGRGVDDAMSAGLFTADLIGHTQVADAGRVADQVSLVASRTGTGYVRLVVGRTCSRCLLLAGRRYSWKADFNRHPKCDCTVIPESEAVRAPEPMSPEAAFKAMARAEQDQVFGSAGAMAIRQGSDIGQVVNAREGMYSAGGKLMTTSGSVRRPRIMPEQIFKEAGGNRAEAVRLLTLHGYIR